MKKKILGLVVLFCCFILVGCSNTSNDTKEIIDQGNTEEKDETSDIELYSSDNRLVFNANNLYYIVVDFGADGYATSLKWIYDYNDSATAKTMVAIIRASLDEDSDVKSVSQDGKYIVVDYDKPAYEDMKRSTTEAAFSMYQKVVNEQN